jgi:hypothetical protein
MSEGRDLPWTTDFILVGAMTRVALQHIHQGRPLAFPEEVIRAYIEAGEALETPLFECEDCGFGLPRSLPRCPLCGGKTGLGVYGVRRTKRCGMN